MAGHHDSLSGREVGELLGLWHAQSEDFAVVFLALDATIVAVNGAVSRVLGYEPDELIGESLRRTFTEEDLAQQIDRHELEVATQLGRAEDDRWHVGKNGRRVWISGVMAKLLDAQGRHIGFAKLLRDRTDIRTEMVTLENQVTDARSAGARKNEFLSTLGHELRNPLHTLANAYELLRSQAGAAPDPRVMAVVERQLSVLTRIIDDLRDVTRIDIGTMALDLEPVTLQDAIRAAIDLHTPAAKARSQTLRCIFPEPDIVVRADSVRLEQILRNLLDNAIKYTPDGGEVSVTATVEGTMGVFRVQDDGIGLSPEVLPRIFDLFTRDDRAVESAAEGLGIGLSLVKNLVHLHGGIIQVLSAGPGKGSEFTVRLPLQAAASTEPPP